MSLRRLLAAAVGLGTCAALVFSCSLDLDESLITKKGNLVDGSANPLADANLPDGTTISESGVPITPDSTGCTKDEECVSANGCLKGKCDLTRRACAYDICHTAACTVGTCDQAAKTCSSPTTHKLKAGEMTLDQPTTGGIIAAYPWLFQLTSTGILVYDVSNPAKSSPGKVPLVGLGFVPNQFVRSGNRIWIGAPLQGQPSRLPVAYIDIPADPFVTKIEAKSVLVNYSRAATESVGFAATEKKGAIVIGPGPGFATAQLDTLLAEPATKTATPLPAKPSTSPVSVSGSRLVMQATDPETGALLSSFGLVSGAGTTAPTAGDIVAIADMGQSSVSRGSAQNLDGTLWYFTGILGPGVGLPGGPVTKSVRAYLLLKDGVSALSGDIKGVDVETYVAGAEPVANTAVISAVTMLDNDTAALATADATSPATVTNISFVKRDLTSIKDKRAPLATPITSIAGASGSDGILYVAANIPPATPDGAVVAKVFLIDPACAP